jgi:3-dehydroquinate dehydratase/shikimate dehydrogenase
MHDFTGVPADLADCARAMRQTGAAVIKIAVSASRLSDTIPLAELARHGDAVVIGMGDAGVPTRLLATRFGSKWTYGGNGMAPGQIPVRAMVEQFRFRDIGPRTEIYGVAGAHALRSATPARQNAAFAAAGRDAVCVPLPTHDKADYQAFADALGVAGATWETGTD